jgi:RhtB (resistance to homoserine/threonine) family protein
MNLRPQATLQGNNMSFWNEWFLLVTVFSVALASPGPDFIMAIRNSVMYGRKAGVITAIGFAAGVMVHLSYCIMGLSAIIAQSALLFTILKFVGAGYLIWVGIKALRSKGMDPSSINNPEVRAVKSARSAFMDGFITNIMNPKAILFFFALFTQILQPEQSLSHMMAYGLTIVMMVALWFSFVALALTHTPIRNRFLKFSKLIDKLCGGLFILLGVRLALQKAH